MLKEITHKIDLPYDTVSETWSQCQGLPVLTEWNKNEGLTVYRGDHYEVPNNIEPPIQRKPFKNTLNADTVGKFSHSKAIEIFKEYLEHEEANLYKYNNAIHVILVLAKAVQEGEIEYTTALECSEMLALGNAKWIEGNREQLNRAIQKTEIRTPYTFYRKFYDLIQQKELRTMKDV